MVTKVPDRLRPFLALVVKDLKGYFDQPTGYILLVILAATLSFLFFREALLTSEASIRPLFDTLPWVLAVFVPAVTMRLVAEEDRDGTLELLFTHPIRDWTIVLAKFLAAELFLMAGIAATVAIPLLLETAGDVDRGATVAQYLGSSLLTGSFIAIGLFTSGITRNQIVAFIIGVTANFFLLAIGLDTFLLAVPSSVAAVLQGLSPLTPFEKIARGVLDMRDMVYFLALILTFLSGAYFMLRRKTLSHRSPLYNNLQVGFVALVVLSLLTGWFGGAIHGRLDLTDEKLYTLSPSTEAILSDLDDVLTLHLYASKDLPTHVSLVRRDVGDFLEDLGAQSDRVRVVHSFPDEDDDAEAWAQQIGIQPVEFSLVGKEELQLKRGFFGLALTYLDRQEIIPFIDSAEPLEYQVATLVHKMSQESRKTVAFLTGFGERVRSEEMLGLSFQLAQQYDVIDVAAAEDGSLNLQGVDLLVVAGPTSMLPDNVHGALHAYMAQGGSMLLLVDPVIGPVTSPELQGQLVVFPNEHGLSAFAERYGIVLNNDLVSDGRVNEAIAMTRGSFSLPVPYPYWPRVAPLENRISGDVSSVLLPWAGSVDQVWPPVDGVEVIPLLQTSTFAVAEQEYLDVTPGQERNFPEAAEGSRLMALAAVGPAPEAGADGESTYRIVVLGDSEWLSDFAVSRAPENMVLGLNVIDWLAQEDALAAIRSKSISPRELLFSSNTHENAVQYGSIFGVPVLFLAIGALRYARRRRISSQVYQDEG